MDLRRLRAGEWILGIGSVLLFLSLFLTWYDGKNIEVTGFQPLGDYSLTGFEALAVIDLLAAAGALLGVAVVVASAMQRVSAVSIAGSGVMSFVSLGLLIAVLFRAARIPDFKVDGATFFEVTRAGGIWVAVAACVVMLGGALVSMRDERITGDTRSVDPATIETLPAPQPGP